jgi:hypothetical protein
MDCPLLTPSQQLLKARLQALHPEQACKDICTVYIATKANSVNGLDYWFHPDFVIPLKKFVKWFNSENYSVTNNEAREVLDHVFTG